MSISPEPPDESASEDWIPDDWIPATAPDESNESKDQTSSNQKSGNQKSGNQKSDNQKSDGKKPTQHSAQLFPIPPASEPAPLNQTDDETDSHRQSIGPLPLVETAFLASAASLMWLINTYFPPGPLLRILFPLPIALVYLRWNLRAAWMAAAVSGLLLTILLGPTRSIFFVMPYGLLGVQLGCLWRRQASWEVSIFTGGVLVALGSFFRIWLLSLLAGEDLWGYLVAQITQFIDWAVRLLTNWGWIGLGALGQPSMEVVAIAAVIMVLFSSVVYLFTVHLAAWLVLERLGVAMPAPPSWVQALIEE
ncbi:MAG: DUF2232 domain-containing protein [Phormidesmis sp.]